MNFLVDLPVLPLERDGLLLTPDGSEFPDLRELCLANWRLLGDLSAGEAFRERLLPPNVQLMDRQRGLCTMPSVIPFVTGVLDG